MQIKGFVFTILNAYGIPSQCLDQNINTGAAIVDFDSSK